MFLLCFSWKEDVDQAEGAEGGEGKLLFHKAIKGVSDR